MSKMLETLEKAFLDTNYWVYFEYPVCVKIGRKNDELDKVIACEWAIITACTPNGFPVGQGENDRNTYHLRKALIESSDDDPNIILPSIGVNTNGTWAPEHGFWAAIGEEQAKKIGKSFSQLAIVVGKYGSEARLVWC